jgi:hypothetical protein
MKGDELVVDFYRRKMRECLEAWEKAIDGGKKEEARFHHNAYTNYEKLLKLFG